MNILLVVPRLNIGGAETYVATIALALHQLGHSVSVASGGGRLVKLLREQGIQHYYVPIRFSVALSAYLLEKIIKENQIEIIHANSAAAGIVAAKVKKKTKVPVVYTAHGVFGHNAKEMTVNYCDRIICVSEFVRKYAIEKGFDENKLITLYSGIDLDKFKPDTRKRNTVRQSLGIPESAFTLAIIARIKNLRNKGHSDILKVLETYKGAHDWHLMVIGKGLGLWKLKYRIWKNKLNRRVHCLGHIVNVQDVLDGADVVVLPSNFETFGLVLAESMAMEKPVVTYAVGGTSEVVEHEISGFLVEKNNYNEFYQRLFMIFNNTAMLAEMGVHGRQRVNKYFNNKDIIEKLIDIYQEVFQCQGRGI